MCCQMGRQIENAIHTVTVATLTAKCNPVSTVYVIKDLQGDEHLNY